MLAVSGVGDDRTRWFDRRAAATTTTPIPAVTRLPSPRRVTLAAPVEPSCRHRPDHEEAIELGPSGASSYMQTQRDQLAPTHCVTDPQTPRGGLETPPRRCPTPPGGLGHAIKGASLTSWRDSSTRAHVHGKAGQRRLLIRPLRRRRGRPHLPDAASAPWHHLWEKRVSVR